MSLRYNAVSSLAFAAVLCHEVCARATKKKVLGIGISYKMLQLYPPYKKGETDIYIKSLYWRKPRASFPAFVAC